MKILKRLLSILLIAILLYLLATSGIILLYAHTDNKEKSDVAIVLGAGTINNEASPVFKERVNHAVELYKEGTVKKIIITGGLGEGSVLADSEVALQYAVECGVPKADLIAEKTSTVTQENLENAAVIMKENGFDMLALVDTHARLNCIVSTSDGNPDDQIETVITKVGEQLHFLTGMDLVSGIGPTVDRLALLHESRSGALTAVNYQCILGDSTVMHFKNMERMDMVFHSQESIHGYLKKLFRENAYATLASAVRNHVTALSGQGPKARKQIQSFLFEFMQDITGEALRLGITVERFDDYLPAMMRLLQSQEDDSVEAVLHFAERIMTSIDGHKNEESNHLILLAKKYIGEHLDDEHMCLESVSDHIGLSRIYFCKLFHKVEGISFNTYLKQERIDLAKRLLLTTNMKVYEISSAAGFSQAKYFGYVFKQVVGLTPLEYQQQNTKSTLNPS